MNDELDKIICQKLDLAKKISKEKSNRVEKIIHESLQNTKIKNTGGSLIKIVSTACASLILTAGIVYAGTVVIEKIWRQPEKVVGFYSEDVTGSRNIITEEEKSSVMSEEEAREKTKTLLEKFGYKNKKIETITLCNNPDDYGLSWYIEVEDEISIEFDAREENFLNLRFNDMLNKDIRDYRTTKIEAEKAARNLCEKYGYDTKKYDKVRITNNLETEGQLKS